jgi:hypothetical protein
MNIPGAILVTAVGASTVVCLARQSASAQQSHQGNKNAGEAVMAYHSLTDRNHSLLSKGHGAQISYESSYTPEHERAQNSQLPSVTPNPWTEPWLRRDPIVPV